MISLDTILPGGLLSPHAAAIAGLIFIAALLQGVSGLGFAMVSAPIAVLYFPELVPGPLLLLGAGLALLGALREFRFIHWSSVGVLMSGRVIGNIAAVATLSVMPGTLFSVVFALLILAGVGLSYAGWRIEPTVPNMVAAGVASGLMGTITSSGAPPYAIVMQHVAPDRMRATLASVFFAGALLSLVMLTFVGHFTVRQFWMGVILLPVMTVGFLASNPLNRLAPRDALRRFLLGLSAAGALLILVRVWLAGA